MNKLNKQLITLLGLIVSIIAMIFINTTVVDKDKYQDINTTSDRMKAFVDTTSNDMVVFSKKAFHKVTFDVFEDDDSNNTIVEVMNNNSISDFNSSLAFKDINISISNDISHENINVGTLNEAILLKKTSKVVNSTILPKVFNKKHKDRIVSHKINKKKEQ